MVVSLTSDAGGVGHARLTVERVLFALALSDAHEWR